MPAVATQKKEESLQKKSLYFPLVGLGFEVIPKIEALICFLSSRRNTKHSLHCQTLLREWLHPSYKHVTYMVVAISPTGRNSQFLSCPNLESQYAKSLERTSNESSIGGCINHRRHRGGHSD
jgi:hypothetical protein